MDFAYTLIFLCLEIVDGVTRNSRPFSKKGCSSHIQGWCLLLHNASSIKWMASVFTDCSFRFLSFHIFFRLLLPFLGVKFKSSWCLFFLLKSSLPLQMQPFPSQHQLCFQSFLNGPHIEEFISFLCRKTDCHDLTMNSKVFLIVKASPNVLQWSWTIFPSLRQGQCGHIIKCFQ